MWLTVALPVGYGLVMVACWLLALIGIAAGRSERIKRHTHDNYSTTPRVYHGVIAWEETGLAFAGFLAAAVWPLAAPAWLAWRKGTFIDREIAARDKEIAS